jgi:hypothetical protein
MEEQPPERIVPVDGGGLRLFYDSNRYGRTRDRVDLGSYGSYSLSDSVTVRSLQATALYVTTAEGLFDAGRSSVSLGVADFRDDDEFSGGFSPFAEVSSGGFFHRDERKRVDYGLTFIAGASTGYEKRSTQPFPLKARVRIPWYAAVAAGGQKEWRRGVTAYGGAMIRYGAAQVRLETPGGSSKYNLRERGLLGLYGGLSARLSDRWRAEGEIQVRGLLDPSDIHEGISGGVTLVWFPGAPLGGEEGK